MATEIDTIITRFETDAAQAIAETQRVSLALESARRGFDGVSPAASRADKAMLSLGERMKIFAREERSEGRTASFFVSQLSAIAPKGSLAADVLGELTQVLVGGAGLGLAFGAVGLATRLVTDSWEKQQKAAKELQEATKKLAQEQAQTYEAAKKTADEAAESLRKAQFLAKGGIELDYRVITAMNARAEAEKRWAEVKKKSDEAKSQGKVAFSDDEWNTEKERLKAAIDAEKAVLAEKGAFVRAFEKDAAAESIKTQEEKAQADFAVLKKLHDQELEALRFSIDEDYDTKEAAAKAQFELAKAEGERLWGLEVERAAKLTALEQATADERKRIQEEFSAFAYGAVQNLTHTFLGAFRPVLTMSASYERAVKASGKASKESADLSGAAFAAMTQAFMADLALQAAAKAIFEVAEGYAMLGTPGMQGFAAAHFSAAANYGIVAGVAAGAAVAIGQTRGMTKAEKASLDSYEASSGGSGSGSFNSIGGSSSAPQTITKTETVFVIGDPFESPAETARRAARAMELARRLDLVRRTG